MSTPTTPATAAPAAAPPNGLLEKVAAQTDREVRLTMETVAGFEALQRAAKLFASSTLVPKVYQGNTPNCVIALNMAARLKADPLMVMQNLYIVHGNPGWSAKFMIATINQCGRFTAVRFEWRGTEGKEDRGCRAWAEEKATGEKLFGSWVDMALVKKEGWLDKNGSKWQSMPEQMFMYRAGTFWARAYAPELSMGLPTADELEDLGVDAGATGFQETPLTEEEKRERLGLLKSIADVKIAFPERVSSALVYLGYGENHNPDLIPLDILRAVAAQLGQQQAPAAETKPEAETVTVAAGAAGQGALLEGPAPKRVK